MVTRGSPKPLLRVRILQPLLDKTGARLWVGAGFVCGRNGANLFRKAVPLSGNQCYDIEEKKHTGLHIDSAEAPSIAAAIAFLLQKKQEKNYCIASEWGSPSHERGGSCGEKSAQRHSFRVENSMKPA